jgi:hypothetical protein
MTKLETELSHEHGRIRGIHTPLASCPIAYTCTIPGLHFMSHGVARLSSSAACGTARASSNAILSFCGGATSGCWNSVNWKHMLEDTADDGGKSRGMRNSNDR